MGYLDLFTQQNDGTRVATPQIVDIQTFPQEIIEFSKFYPELPMDQVAQKYYEYQSKKQSLDQGKEKTPYDKEQSTIKQKYAEVQEKEIEKAENTQKALKEVDGMMKFISPSNYVELFSGKDLNAGQEFAADILLDPTSYASFGLLPFLKKSVVSNSGALIKQLYKIAPEYKDFIKFNNHLNPLSQEALDQFFEIQSKSTRGSFGNSISDVLNSLQKQKPAGMRGPDAQRTGGIYTSNSRDLSKSFSTYRNAEESTSQLSGVADLQVPFNIDKTLDLDQQLKQYKKQIRFNTDKHNSNNFSIFGLSDYIQKKFKPDARFVEAPYNNINTNIPTHERIILYDNPHISNIEITNLHKDTKGRMGVKDIKKHNEYFYPYKLGSLPEDRITKGINTLNQYIIPGTLFTSAGAGAAGIVPYMFNKPEYSWFNLFKKEQE